MICNCQYSTQKEQAANKQVELNQITSTSSLPVDSISRELYTGVVPTGTDRR